MTSFTWILDAQGNRDFVRLPAHTFAASRKDAVNDSEVESPAFGPSLDGNALALQAPKRLSGCDHRAT